MKNAHVKIIKKDETESSDIRNKPKNKMLLHAKCFIVMYGILT